MSNADKPRNPSAAPATGLGRNGLWALAPRLTLIASNLALTPFILAGLGLRAYGFWALAFSFIQVSQLFDGGVPATASALVARRSGAGDKAGAATAATFAALIVSGLGAAVVMIGLTFSALAPDAWLAEAPEGARAALGLVAVAIAGTLIGNGLLAAISGLELWVYRARAMFLGQISNVVLTVGALLLDRGVAGLAAAAAISAAVTALAALSGLRAAGLLGLTNERRATFKYLVRHGGNLQISGIADVMNTQADRFLLLPFSSLAWVAAYDLGARVAQAVRALPLGALVPLFARFATVFGRDGLDALRQEYVRVGNGAIAFVVAPAIALSAVAYPMVLVWLGPEHERSAAIAVVLSLGFSFHASTVLPNAAASAGHKTAISRDYALVMLLVNVGLSVPLAVVFGPWGVVLGTFLGLVIGTGVCFLMVRRWMHVPNSGAVKSAGKAAPAIVACAIAVALGEAVAPSTRIEHGAVAAGAMAIGALSFGWPIRHHLLETAKARARKCRTE